MARRRCLERDNYHCRDCQRAAGRFEIHHVIPLAAGGSALDGDNLLSLCRDCQHARHRDESPEVGVPGFTGAVIGLRSPHCEIVVT